LFESKATSGNSSQVGGLAGLFILGLWVGTGNWFPRPFGTSHIRGMLLAFPFQPLHVLIIPPLFPNFPTVVVHDVRDISVNKLPLNTQKFQ
jgi:hypothetical protein